MMLAEQTLLARSQHDELQQLILLVLAVIKNHQVQPLHQNNHQPKTDGNVNNNARIARSSFISIETESTKSSGAPLPQVIWAAAPDNVEGALPHILPTSRSVKQHSMLEPKGRTMGGG